MAANKNDVLGGTRHVAKSLSKYASKFIAFCASLSIGDACFLALVATLSMRRCYGL